jgi:hypothetical protein
MITQGTLLVQFVHLVDQVPAPLATFLLSRGTHPKVVQEMLGHADTSQTMDAYSHVLPDMQNGAVSEIERGLSCRVASKSDRRFCRPIISAPRFTCNCLIPWRARQDSNLRPSDS